MKRKFVYTIGLLAATAIVLYSGSQQNAHSNSSGAPTSGACTGCHSGSILSSDDVFVVLTDTAFTPVDAYQAGQTYLIGFGSNDSTINKAGFALSATAGTFSKLFSTDNTISITSGFVTHTTIGTADTEWGARWTAPSSATSPVTFTLFFNEANGDGGIGGDKIYRRQLVLAPSTATGLGSTTNPLALHTFPNPAKQELNIAYQLPTASDVTITIYTIDGKVKQSITNNANLSGIQEAKLTLDQFEPGIYFIRIDTGTYQATRKIIVQ
jgi:hypothetical protein